MDKFAKIGRDYIAETFIGLKVYEFVSLKVPLYWAVVIGYCVFVGIRWWKERRRHKKTSKAGHA